METSPELRLRFETSFVVMPQHCNYRLPQIFGGAFMAELDLCAASACTELLQHSTSPCDQAVTFKMDVKFLAAAQMGDLVFLQAEIVELRQNAIVLEVQAHRQAREIKNPERILCAEAEFVFVSKRGEQFYPHGLKME